ncbi:MauE/DoxX family redox-associated membrane protein [uncultured Serinicoccus sp.]|uniref:MauE/DoxX family redox-associated membrane protein n=1 Tax=uncultured Serinicoccus sp. TaxID=735514 RepID=UPI00262AF000|nr:MauE/DoxX family redox-associated membrane protein [uncultured Serinicoccus sp.]
MSVLAAASTWAVALVLLVSGLSHARAPRSTRAALQAHGTLPSSAHRWLALVLGPVELVLAVGLLAVGLGVLGRPVVPVLGLGAAVLCLGFAAYLHVVRRRTVGQEVPCGCGLGTTPVTGWSVVRAGVLGVLALAAVVLPTGPWAAIPGAPVWAQVVVAAAGGLTLAVATAALPAARAVPAGLTTLTGAVR